MKKFNELYRPSEQGITYERYCGILDEILVEQLQEQGGNWWSKLSPDEQDKYIKKHPQSKQAKQARAKQDKDTKDKEEPKEPKKTDDVDLDKYTKSTDSEEDKIKIKNIATKLKNHINDVVKETGLGAKEAVDAFKQPGVYNTLKGVGFSMKTLGKTVLGGLRTGNVALKGVAGELTKSAPFKALKAGTMKADEFLDKHPKLKKIGGVAVAGLACAQWYHMSFSGDIESDYDLSVVGDALQGNYSMTDLLTSPSGVAGLGLLAAGLATGGLPIWLGGGRGLALALAKSGMKAAGKFKAAEKIHNKMQMMKNTMKKKIVGENQMEFKEIYSSVLEKDEHKKTREYKRLSPKLRNAVDDIFKKMDSKPQDFLNTFDKTIKDVAKKYRVREKDLLGYFEKELLAI